METGGTLFRFANKYQSELDDKNCPYRLVDVQLKTIRRKKVMKRERTRRTYSH